VAKAESGEIADPGEELLEFGPFELRRSSRVLLDGGSPVRLGSRAFEILLSLVERAGQVVSKRDLIARTWPGLFVEQSNLRVHVAALRKALRDPHAAPRYIRSVSGSGYSFIAPVTNKERSAPVVSNVPLALPTPLTDVIGRTEAVEAITKQVKARRLVTIVGPGGIGKSTVAQAAAEQFAAYYARRVHLVDLSVIDNPRLTTAALATAIGVSVSATEPVKSIIAFFQDLRALLVLDNCEHVIEAAAQLIEGLLQGAPRVDILVTSREPLLVQGESIYRLDALTIPPLVPSLTAAQARTYSAVELFLERAAGNFDDFVLTDENAHDVAMICSRLDGIPLAIELAATRVDLLGVRGLLTQLDRRLLLLSKGRRTAQPRHRSLRALLDWSHEVLSSKEQTILRRLSVFRGAFSARSAVDVVSDDTITASAVDDGLIVLAGKSLVNTESSEETISYRLLQTTRTYASEKLETDPLEHNATRRRHAEHLCSVLTDAQTQWDTLPRSQWVQQYARLIDDVRSALDWAFAPDGDVALGATLTAAALPCGFQLGQIDEFARRAERALQTLAGLCLPQPVVELRLTAALAVLLSNMGSGEDRAAAMYRRAVEIADRIGVAKLKVEPLTSQAVFQLELGNYSAAVEACETLADVAEASHDSLATLIADRAAAQAYHFAGDHARSRRLAERVLNHPARAIPLAYSQASVDKAVSMRIILARILWLEGRADQAWQVVEESLRLASADGPFAMCQALALAGCPIALWRGDPGVHLQVEKLLQFSTRYTLQRWHAFGLCFQAVLAEERRGVAAAPGVDLANNLPPRPISVMHRDLLATVSDRWIDEATIARAQSGLSGWCAPEVLRVSGELDFRRGGAEAQTRAEARFMDAIEKARAQRALAWELRAAISFARLLSRTGRAAEAQAHLEPVYDSFTEGHQTSDLRTAAELLREISQTLQ
jgi:predicted ATPase/DNA-binding winged helix-turn-helix (wHTH) protein